MRLGTRPMRRVLIALAVLLSAAHSSRADTVRYYHLDGIGNVRVITDENKNVVERHEFLPYGEEWCMGPPQGLCGSPPPGQPRRFTGKERDAETGLDYFGARYYGSKIGRFTTVDPVLDQQATLLNPQRWNRYAYVSNNPLRYVDPDGREQAVIVGGRTYMGGVDGMSAGDEQARNVVFGAMTAAVGLATPGPEDLVVVGLAARAERFLGRVLSRVDDAVDFSADLSKTAATSRSGHSYAGNKQLHEAMEQNSALHRRMEAKYGDDALDRTSTSGGGRRNPRAAEWDHNSKDPKRLDLRSKDNHAEKTRREGQAGGGWKKFHKDPKE